jgi:hypothetical protein
MRVHASSDAPNARTCNDETERLEFMQDDLEDECESTGDVVNSAARPEDVCVIAACAQAAHKPPRAMSAGM